MIASAQCSFPEEITFFPLAILRNVCDEACFCVKLKTNSPYIIRLLQRSKRYLVNRLFLNYFRPVFPFCIPGKRQKTRGFLTFSGGMEREHWTEIG